MLARVEDPQRKARVLQAVMERLQGGGWACALRAGDRGSRGARAAARGGLGTDADRPESHSDAQVRRALEVLWRRGDPGVDVAIEQILDARPELGTPEFLQGLAGTRLCCRPRADEVMRAVELVEREYWNVTTSRETLLRVHERAPIWVGARDESGRLIATARACSDGGKHGWIYDVAVDPSWRGCGVRRGVAAPARSPAASRRSARALADQGRRLLIYEVWICAASVRGQPSLGSQQNLTLTRRQGA